MSQKEPVVTIVIVNFNTAAFVETTLSLLARITSNPYRVLVCDNGSRWLDRWRLRRAIDRHPRASVRFRTQTAGSSRGHGEALNLLANDIETPYGVFLDADATFLRQGWDELLLEKFDETVKIIGAPPVENPKKPTDFPSLYATMFETAAFKSLEIDLRPDDPAAGRDTGWEMREKFQSSEYDAQCLVTKNTREYKNGPFSDLLCAEFYLPGEYEILACHFGRGATMGAAKYYKGTLWDLPIIGILPKYIRGYRERERWLRRCRAIVESQLDQ